MKEKPHSIERHHIPADSVTTVSRDRGLAIQMEKTDHAQTSSFRNSSSARAYRQAIKEKVDAGDLRGAIAQECWDVKRVGGTKYNDALAEMLEYGKASGIIPERE